MQQNPISGSKLALFTWALASALTAQGQDIMIQRGTASVEVFPATAAPIVVAPPPRMLGQDASLPDHKKSLPPTPRGDGALAPPDSPQTAPTPHGSVGPASPCDLHFFTNTVVKPPGASTSLVGEPSVGQTLDTAWFTGNWYAARSLDSGASWSYVSPYTRFPAVDGGFCCDQRVLYIPSHDITIWLLQNTYSSTTQQGGQRIAVARGRADLQAGATGTWAGPYLRPTNFGRPLGEWLDFPDIAFSNGFLYGASNIFDANSQFTDAVVWRIPLTQLANYGGIVSYEYGKRSTGLSGHSYRLTQHAQGTMYFAAHMSTTSLRAYRWPNSGSIAFTNVTVSDWSSSTGYVATAPNGVNWGGRNDGRITGAWYRPGEYGFMWSAAPRAGRPRCYVKVARINEANHALWQQADIWHGDYDFMYPAADTSSSGDIGFTLALSSNSRQVHPCSAWGIVDGCRPNFDSGVTYLAGNASPTAGNRWGDYFTVQRHSYITNTFVGTGMACRDGGANANSEPRYVWFGREQSTPPYPTLDVSSTGVSGVPVVVSVMDRNRNQNGAANFQRVYSPGQTYSLTAPRTHRSGLFTYVFERWAWSSRPAGSLVNQPLDQLTLTVGIGTDSDTAVARYVGTGGISVGSTNPGSGVAITVSVPDINGGQNGTTAFSRTYRGFTTVLLTAPTTAGGNTFQRWRLDNVDQPLGQVTLSVSTQPLIGMRATAVYRTSGFVSSFGQSCVGSFGTPRHSATGAPELGRLMSYGVTQGHPFGSAGLLLGGSNTTYRGVPLPLDLSPIGVTGCHLYASRDLVVPFALDPLGAGSVAFTIPNSPHLVGRHFYTQVQVIDTSSGRRVPLTMTNGLDTRIGTP